MQFRNQTLIHHFLEESARKYPDKIALVYEDVRATYWQINTSANHLAGWLIDQGIRNGDRIALLMENCLEYVISYYSILKAGAVAVPISSDIRPDGLSHLLEELEPKAIIASSRSEKVLGMTDLNEFKVQALILKNPKLKWEAFSYQVFSWQDVVQHDEAVNPSVLIQESALANIIYTSGSTGKPKGVMLSHKNIVSNAHSICQYLCLTEEDIQMVVLPFFYVMGKSLLNTHFAVGGTVVINNKFAFPASVVNQIAEENVTGFSGVPSTYAYLLHRSPLASYKDRLESLRYCSQAGGHMSRQIKEDLISALPAHTEIYIMYGATEASARLTYLEPNRLKEKIDSIGKAIPGVSLKILDREGHEVPVGDIGELVAEGPNIMQGYWKNEKATIDVLNSNGYHTGDLGYQDSEGYFYVVGREDNLIKVGGHRINPQEIEDAVLATGEAIESVVLGIKDDLLGHKLVALVVPKESECKENHILALCTERLPKYKMPSEIKLVRALPKSSSGKIDRTKCNELIKSPKK